MHVSAFSLDRSPRRRGLAAALAVLLLLTAGCAGATPSRSAGEATSGAAGGAADQVAVPAGPPGQAGGGGGAGAPAPGSPNVAPSQAEEARKVIRTGSMTVRNKDVDAATRKAREIVAEQDGNINSSRESGEGSNRTSRLVIKVAPEKFDDTMAKLRQTGQVVSSEAGQQDVTEQVVDLEARLKAATASRDRVQELTKQAGSITELIALERELNTRNQEVDSLTARLKAINSQVAESTITLNIGATSAAARPAGTFGGGFDTGWAAFQWVLSALAVLVGFLVPFLPVIALLVLAVWAWRRYRRRHPRPAKVVSVAGAPWGGWEPATGPAPRRAPDPAPAPAPAPAPPPPTSRPGPEASPAARAEAENPENPHDRDGRHGAPD